MSLIRLSSFRNQMWERTQGAEGRPPAHSDTCTCAHTHTHRRISELMSDLPHVDSVMGCGLEHSNRTSGQVGQNKGRLVVVRPSLWAPGKRWSVMCSAVTSSLPCLPLWFHTISVCLGPVCCPFLTRVTYDMTHVSVPDVASRPTFFGMDPESVSSDDCRTQSRASLICPLEKKKKLMTWQDVLWPACRVCMQESSRPDLWRWCNKDVWPGWDNVLRPGCCSAPFGTAAPWPPAPSSIVP